MKRWGLLILALACGACVHTHRAQEQRTVEAEYHPGTKLDVDTRNGSVTVKVDPHAPAVQVVAEIQASGSDGAEATQRLKEAEVMIARDGDLLRIEPWFPGDARSHDGCSLEVTLPRVEGVTVDTTNGAIRVEDAEGPADLRTSNGSVRVERHRGDVRVSSSNGGVLADGVQGSLAADTSNGGIEVRGVAGSIDLETSNGRIELALPSGWADHFEVDTSNGRIEIEGAAGVAATIDASTSNGSIDGSGVDMEGSRTRAIARFGSGGTQASRASTSNGNIRIRVAGASGGL